MYASDRPRTPGAILEVTISLVIDDQNVRLVAEVGTCPETHPVLVAAARAVAAMAAGQLDRAVQFCLGATVGEANPMPRHLVTDTPCAN